MISIVFIILHILSVSSVFNIPENTEICYEWVKVNPNVRISCQAVGGASGSTSWMTSSPKDFEPNTPAIGGNIPSELFSITDIQELFLFESDLSGVIPSEIGNFNIEKLNFSSNKISGKIPPEIGNITSLKVLDLSNNSLSGTIPSELGNLKNLRILKLNNNFLQGVIPSELSFIGLIELDLDRNDLEGKVPQFSIFSRDGKSFCRLDNSRLLCPMPGSCTPICNQNSCPNSECPCQINGLNIDCDTQSTSSISSTTVQDTSSTFHENTATTQIESKSSQSTSIVKDIIESTNVFSDVKETSNSKISEENSHEVVYIYITIIVAIVAIAIIILALGFLVYTLKKKERTEDFEMTTSGPTMPSAPKYVH